MLICLDNSWMFVSPEELDDMLMEHNYIDGDDDDDLDIDEEEKKMDSNNRRIHHLAGKNDTISNVLEKFMDTDSSYQGIETSTRLVLNDLFIYYYFFEFILLKLLTWFFLKLNLFFFI